MSTSQIAVVIPCYKCRNQILGVLQKIPSFVEKIFVVDDACPEKTGEFVRANFRDPRCQVITLEKNSGVGGAVLAGMHAALKTSCRYFVKVDGDGQMDPALIPRFILPLKRGLADYTKGNRFYKTSYLRQMPPMRIFGNSGLTFLCRFSSGYWQVSDPTNGYLAIHRAVFENLETDKISQRFFFESDLLFHIGLLKAVVAEIPMRSFYGDEQSNLKIFQILFPFLKGHLKNFTKRIFYNYFLRSFSLGSIFLIIGIPLLVGGVFLGASTWWVASQTGAPTPTGTVVLVAMLNLIGLQMILGFFQEDMASLSKVPFQNLWNDEKDLS